MQFRPWFPVSCLSALALIVALTTLQGQAVAQCVAPPTLEFGEKARVQYHSAANEVALRGTVDALVTGRIRHSQLEKFELALTPAEDNQITHAVRRFRIQYRTQAGVPAAQLCWKDLGATKKLMIEGAPARAYFHQSKTVSHGVARVEFTFIEGGPGRLVVMYQHQRYKHGKGQQLLQVYETICFGTPLVGQRLSFTTVQGSQQLSQTGR